ncbi:MAG TPA: ATP-dependent RNA helicase HrpA [Polyangiaceae bacterium]|nr:ATP-dependent RNA helicase HrpA [Polyangiaceae bacterium]
MNPASLAAEIDRCMLRDRHRLRRRLDAIRGRHAGDETAFAELGEAVKASQERRAAREAGRPRPTYPPDLPVALRKDEIARAIADAQVVIVCGETGSGKTTQLPKICLDLGRGVAGLIGHTQPRRLAARTLAARIATELDTEVGSAVGYKIRFTDRVSDATYVKLMTDGILLAETQGDRFLEQYDTIIIDEAHERSINIDFLLGYLKRLLPKRPDLKVIVTSATIDPQRFAAHFGGAPIIEVSGRVYPVEMRYRPPPVADADDEEDGGDARSGDDALLSSLLDAVRELPDQSGDVLVFLPGEQSIREAADALRKAHTEKTEILPLYARLSAGEQTRVFRPHTGRRIVLATNVAETSLTVPGVRYVIDTGLARVSRYDTRRKVQQLPIEKISQASANQRTGRAGRTSAGVCIRLYSEEDFAARPVFTPPEIVRTNLASVILQMAALGLGSIEEFPFVEPPGTRAIRDGAATLFELGAFDEEHRLTRVGRELSRLPVDPRVGRIILGGRDHRCLAEILVIASALSVQDPRYRPHDAKEKADQAHRRFQSETSDFVSYLKLWDAFQEEAGRAGSRKLRTWCESQFISFLRMREWQDVHRQLHQLVRGMGFPIVSGHGDDAALHKALLTGYLGSVAMKQDDRIYVGARNVKLNIFPGSALFKNRPAFIMAAEMVETGRLYARTVAKIEPEWVEPLAEHLVERRYFEPRWDKSRGQVVGFEKVTLHGLPIVARRRIDFARIDAEAAREIFIREALVTGELNTPGAFLRHNCEVVASIERLADRARRRDLLVDEQAVFAFYDRALPADVWSGRRFDAWRKTIEHGSPRALFLAPEDVLIGDAAAVDAEMFPDALEVGGLRLPLTYRFEPGHEEDGITVTVPLAALNELDAAPFAWLVPGFLVDQVTALLESLPKSIRKIFVPVRDTAERFVRERRAHSPGAQGGATETLASALSRYLEAQKRIAVPVSAFNPAAGPEYLRMLFRVVDEQGRQVAQSRDLTEQKGKLGLRARESFGHASRSHWERDRVTSWDFGDLSERVEVRQGSFSLPGYPALVAEKDGVALRVFQHPGEAALEHRRGVRRLLAMRIAETTKVVRRNLPGIQAMTLQFAMIGSGDSLRDDIVEAAIDRAGLGDGPPPRSKDAFERCAEQARGRLAGLADEVCARVAPILAAYQDVARLLPAASRTSAAAPSAEIRDHVARLIYPGFVSETPFSQLAHLPRYLKAVRLRIERLPNQPAKDRARQAELLPHWQAYTARADADEARGTRSSELERYRWLLEEFRVSLFAQELRTAEPISTKKIAEQWAKVMAEGAR